MELYELQNVATGGFGEYWKQIFQNLPPVDLELYKRGNRGFYILREVYNDPHIFGAISSRKSGTLMADWNVRGDHADAVLSWLSKLDVPKIIEGVLDTVFFGFQVFEINWDNNYMPIEVIQRFPGDFRIVEGKLVFIGRGSEEVYPDEKFIYMAFGQNLYEIYGSALLSKVYYYWQFLRATTKLWVKFVEKYGIPLTNVTANVADEEQQEIAQKIWEAISGSVIVHSENLNIDFFDPGQKDGSVFINLIDHCKLAINQVILGHERGTMATPGQLGNEKLAINVRDDLIRADRRFVESFFDKLIGYWFKFQNLQGEQPYFYFVPEEDLQMERARRDQILSQIGVSFTPEYWKKHYNLEPEDTTFSNPLPSKVTLADKIIEQAIKEDPAGLGKQTKKLYELLENKKSLQSINFADLYNSLTDDEFIEKMEKLLTWAYLRGKNGET